MCVCVCVRVCVSYFILEELSTLITLSMFRTMSLANIKQLTLISSVAYGQFNEELQVHTKKLPDLPLVSDYSNSPFLMQQGSAVPALNPQDWHLENESVFKKMKGLSPSCDCLYRIDQSFCC